MKTTLAVLMLLVSAGSTFAQSDQPVKVSIAKAAEGAYYSTQRVRSLLLIALSNNPHYAVVDEDADWEFGLRLSCVKEGACAVEEKYQNEYGVIFPYALGCLTGSDEHIAQNILGDLIEDTTPQALRAGREYTKNITEAIKGIAREEQKIEDGLKAAKAKSR